MRFLRPIEVMDLLRVTKATLKRMEDRGELHPMRLPNGHRRYRIDELEKLIGEKIE